MGKTLTVVHGSYVYMINTDEIDFVRIKCECFKGPNPEDDPFKLPNDVSGCKVIAVPPKDKLCTPPV